MLESLDEEVVQILATVRQSERNYKKDKLLHPKLQHTNQKCSYNSFSVSR